MQKARFASILKNSAFFTLSRCSNCDDIFSFHLGGDSMSNRILLAPLCAIFFHVSIVGLVNGQRGVDSAAAQSAQPAQTQAKMPAQTPTKSASTSVKPTASVENADHKKKPKNEDDKRGDNSSLVDESVYNASDWPPDFASGVICYWNSTYDRKEGDINQLPGNYGLDSDRLNKFGQNVEVVQTSWFRRSACMRDIRRANAFMSALGAVGYVVSKDNATPISSNGFASLALLAVVNDQLRAVSPLSRFYTGAVTGTHLAGMRNEFVESRANALATMNLNEIAICDQVIPLERHAAGINSAANKVFDKKPETLQVAEAINQYKVSGQSLRRWCEDYQALSANFALYHAQSGELVKEFNKTRVGAWLKYRQFVNTVGQENKPTAYSALSRIITTPFDVANKLLGGGDDSLVLRNAGVVQSKAVMAMEMPQLNLQNISIPPPAKSSHHIGLEYRQARMALIAYFNTYCGGGRPDENSAGCKDYKGLNFEQDPIAGQTASWHAADTEWRKIQAHYTELQTHNARRFLWISLDNGTAYVGTDNLAVAEPAPAAKAQP